MGMHAVASGPESGADSESSAGSEDCAEIGEAVDAASNAGTFASAQVTPAMLVCAQTATALQQAGVSPEKIAEFVPVRRKLLVFSRPATMRPLAEGWRLGSLLLDTAGGLWAAGRATRAAERGRIGYQSLSREDRRDLAAAALRGGYPVGTTVHFDAHPLRLDEASVRSFDGATQIGWVDGQVRVRWHVGAPLTGAPTLEQYLSERVGLLIDPPLGAS